MKQAKSQLRRKSQQVQESLVSRLHSLYSLTPPKSHYQELDLKILHELAEREREEEAIQSSRRRKAEADAQYMKHVVEEQLQLEREREEELELLYQ